MALERCRWARDRTNGGRGAPDPLMVTYHDEEWGVPIYGERDLFERLMLEAFQAGLSWRVVLSKRAAMAERFFDFDARALATADALIDTWLEDAAIIRHRLKLEALVSNARAFVALDDPGDFLWSVVDGSPVCNRFASSTDVPSRSPAGDLLSKRLKKAGFRFVGPVVCYAFMQSAGFVNDHVRSCFRWSVIDASNRASATPGA